jgi:hypothetical protein
MSAAVSLVAQNVGGEFIHPMVRDSGTAMSWGSPSYRGSSAASLRASSASMEHLIESVCKVKLGQVDRSLIRVRMS